MFTRAASRLRSKLAASLAHPQCLLLVTHAYAAASTAALPVSLLPLGTRWSRAARTVGLVSSVTLLSLPALAWYDPGVARSLYFNYYALPALAHYRLVERQLRWRGATSDEEHEAALRPLHEKYAPMSLRVVLHLKGFYVKLCQVGCTRSDFVAEPYITRWETLLDGCPTVSIDVVLSLLRSALGVPLSAVFESIDPVPLGAASIGQVHRAQLVGGTQVAVKVQYPAVEALFRGDLRTLRAFCKLAQPEHLPALDEVERAFATEFDYGREADVLRRVADNVDASPFSRSVVVPRPVEHLCKKGVLVMDFLNGEPLVAALRRRAEALAAASGRTPAELRAAWARAAAAAGTSAAGEPTAPKAAPFWRRSARVAAVRALDAAHNAPLRLRNLGRRLRGSCARDGFLPLRRTPPPLEVDDVLSLLCAVHAHQVFVDGLFNADCHPGNVLLLNDGRLGLVDYGQACELSVAQRADLARLILALADGRRDDVVRIFRSIGYATRSQSDGVAYAAAVVSFDRDDRAVTGGLNVQAWLEKQAAEDPCLAWPETFLMASRNTFILRGFGIVLGRPMSVAKAWRPVAEAFLREHNEPLV